MVKYKVQRGECKDHIHMIIESGEDKLPEIMKTLKSVSALRYKETVGIPTSEAFHLWAQKYNKWRIESVEEFKNTMRYINRNKVKHSLPQNKGLKPLVSYLFPAKVQ